MLDIKEIRNSISAVLYERVSSPLSGTFIFSWIIWNWKLLYYVLSENTFPVVVRIYYIETNLLPLHNLVYFPLLSTFFLLSLYPFLSTGAYQIYLKFNNWNLEIKQRSENQRLLSLEQSIELRLEMKNLSDKFEESLKDKDKRIELLSATNEKLINEIKAYGTKDDDYKIIISTNNQLIKEVKELKEKNENIQLLYNASEQQISKLTTNNAELSSKLKMIDESYKSNNDGDKLNQTHMEILGRLAINPYMEISLDSYISKQYPKNQVLSRTSIDELGNFGYISQTKQGGQTFLKLTDKGIKYLLENDMLPGLPG